MCIYIYDPEDRAHPPQEDRGTPKGGAFWGRSTEEKRLGLGVAVWVDPLGVHHQFFLSLEDQQPG